MFTGIVQGLVKVELVEHKGDLIRFSIQLPTCLLSGIELGASIAVDGVCLTVAHIESDEVYFEVIQETLNRTTLKTLQHGQLRNIERSAHFGKEVGGHLVSGHVLGEATLTHINSNANNRICTFSCPSEWMKYILEKGFITLDGASLTIVEPKPCGEFKIHFIPETLARSTLGIKKVGDNVNLEVDSHTQAIVDTVERVLAQKTQ